jgi:hypothetical protein
MGVAVGAIWLAVLAISLLAPDMVSGSEQQHMPVAAFGTWLWGIAGTWAALGSLAALRRSSRRRHLHQPLALGVAGIWTVAAAVSVFGPVVETGSDPTRLPLAAMVAPVAATVLTGLLRAATDLVASLLDDSVDDDLIVEAHSSV